jgi:hypothetical protein
MKLNKVSLYLFGLSFLSTILAFWQPYLVLEAVACLAAGWLIYREPALKKVAEIEAELAIIKDKVGQLSNKQALDNVLSRRHSS